MEASRTDNTNKKKTIFRRIAFVLILAVLLCAFDYASYKGPLRSYINKVANLNGSRYGYDEVAPVISFMSEQDGSTKLILGDSVANQLFDGVLYDNPDFRICPVNRAITFAGQYILVKEYLKSHPDATDVYIVFYSGTLASDIDPLLSYQYIAMPFIIHGYGDDLDPLVMGKLKKTYGSFFLKPAVLDYINESGLNRALYLNAVTKINEKFTETKETPVISDVSIDYLKQIYALCSENGVNVHLVSTPLCDIPSRRSECDEIRKVFAETGLDELYPDYCDSFIFCDSSMFMDEVHFAPEYKNRETLNPYIRQMISGLLGSDS